MKHFYLNGFAIFLAMSAMSTVMANNSSHFRVRNNTAYTMEFSGLVGGYASKNPLVQGGASAMILPDPGSNEVKGHLMLYSNKPGQYVDNIVFDYRFVQQHWAMKAYDLYNHVQVNVQSNQLILR